MVIKYTKLFESDELGDCYDANGRYFMDTYMFSGKNPDAKLVHGLVTGQGPLEGVQFGHCWVEDGDLVIDKSNGNDIKIPKKIYYKLGKIDPNKNVYKYSLEEFEENITKFEHWGPWEKSLW